MTVQEGKMANLVSQLALKNRKLAEDYGRQFKNTFGIDLGSFMDWINSKLES